MATEKIGEDRLGSPNIFQGIGSTVLFLSLLFLLIVILITIIVVCCKMRKLSEKSKERVENLKRKIMYNPLIRYLMLNSLKFNYSAMCVFKHANSGAGSYFVAALMLILINSCPIIFTAVLFKKNNDLTSLDRVN